MLVCSPESSQAALEVPRLLVLGLTNKEILLDKPKVLELKTAPWDMCVPGCIPSSHIPRKRSDAPLFGLSIDRQLLDEARPSALSI